MRLISEDLHGAYKRKAPEGDSAITKRVRAKVERQPELSLQEAVALYDRGPMKKGETKQQMFEEWRRKKIIPVGYIQFLKLRKKYQGDPEGLAR